jgi:hypothetical protein
VGTTMKLVAVSVVGLLIGGLSYWVFNGSWHSVAPQSSIPPASRVAPRLRRRHRLGEDEGPADGYHYPGYIQFPGAVHVVVTTSARSRPSTGHWTAQSRRRPRVK